jgi:hypothetical protein
MKTRALERMAGSRKLLVWRCLRIASRDMEEWHLNPVKLCLDSVAFFPVWQLAQRSSRVLLTGVPGNGPESEKRIFRQAGKLSAISRRPCLI